MDQGRRKFLKISSAVFISNGISKLSIAGDNAVVLDHGDFLHGVASGDPLQDKVIIWTRVTPPQQTSLLQLSYEVAEDAIFSRLVHSGFVTASSEEDYTVKIDLHNLRQDTVYYYRFKTANAISSTGKTRTLPVQTDQVTLAVFSCANYTGGYFNAYHDACKFAHKIDVVIHLGDYVYEYGMHDQSGEPAYATKNAQAIGRSLPSGNDKELSTLADYRNRYALYRSDPDLQKIHSLYPFICIWDDHEFVNNAFSTGAKQYTELEAEKFQRRKKDAIKAYCEWLPIRVSAQPGIDHIYRNFNFGTLLSLNMLDTRLLSRSRQLEYDDYLQSDASVDLTRFATELKSPERDMIGKQQLAWLEREITASSAQWQFIAQQVRLSEDLIPLEMVQLAGQYKRARATHRAQLKQTLIDTFNELINIKARMELGDSTLTRHETDRLKVMLPYNLDSWDGYPVARKRLYQVLQNASQAVVVLSGDAHYSWANELVEGDKTIAIELGVTSVSSPGIEEDYDIEDPSLLDQMEKVSSLFNKQSRYSNYSNRGYMIVEVNRADTRVHWRYVNTVLSRDYEIIKSRSHMLRIAYRDGQYYLR